MNPTLIPPGVCGRVRGSISIAIDEVFWSGAPQGSVYVKFSWWGGEEFYEFFPSDLTKASGHEAKRQARHRNDQPTSHTFPIGTSLKFLEDYFRKWGSIPFNVYRVSDKRLLGTARVDNWECILSDARYGSYFAILDKKENRIGDLHIVFTLKMKKKKYKLKSDFPIVRDAPLTGAGPRDKEMGGEMLTDLLTKGQELRKAMVKSVLSSCETKDLDEVVSSEVQPTTVAEKQSEAKLVDFLMGKELSEADKEIALNTLRCTSPSESVLEVAASLTDHSHSRETNKAPAFEGPFQKKFCTVGEKKCAVGSEKNALENPLSPKRFGSRNSAREAFLETNSVAHGDELPDKAYPVFECIKKVDDSSVNSYKVSFSVLTLTALGLKKVSTTPTIKPLNNKIRPAKSPGIVFSIETMMPFTPKSKTTFLKPVTMSSKAFGGNDAVFSESVVRKLRRSNEPAWIKVGQCIAGLPIKIYWRCLNQRLPSLLGQCMLPDVLESEDFEAHCQLHVYMTNRQVAAILSCKIELGASGVFGNELLGRDKTKRKSYFESMIPQFTEVPPSRASISSVKSVSQENSKETCSTQIPPPPPSARCRTASSAASNSCREPIESDQQLLDAISCLNEKLTKRTVLFEKGDPTVRAEDSVVDGSQPTSARSVEPALHKTTVVADEAPKDVPDVVGEKNCRLKSPRGCCCCCRGCPGDCKRRKSLRRKQLRDQKHPSRGSDAIQDESTALSNTDGDMSPEGRSRLAVNSLVRERFHSPPTRLNRKTKNLEQPREGVDLQEKLDTLYRDIHRDGPPDHVPSRTQDIPSDLYKNEVEGNDKFIPRSPSDLPSVHRFVVNVYSSDAHIFYREGELELYMVYRFPQVDPVSGKLFCPSDISTVELSGDGAPVTHYLPLRTSLSEALLSYPKHNITFHIWARAYLYEKRDFLIGQAKLPLEKLVEWEAAHVYSQKRRIDHPLLPPDKHFINLRIHPAKGELPQHLEPGRIAQLGLEIDYEKFRDANDSLDAWHMNSTDSPGRPYYPTSHVARDEVTDSSDPYLNFKQDFSRNQNGWNHETRPLGGFSEKSGKWGVRLVDSFTDPKLPSAPQGFSKTGFSEPPGDPSARDEEEFMLILDGCGEPNHSARKKTGARCANLSDHQVPDVDRSNGIWGDGKLEFQSFSRIDPANTTEFIPDEELRAQLMSPRVDRDFPPGVRTADFSSDNNSDHCNNPFNGPATVHPQLQPNQQEVRVRVADQSSPLPSLAKIIDPNYRARNRSPVDNLDSSCELGSDSKATQTTLNERNVPSLFAVRIEVESAINLPQIRKNGVLTKPSSRVEFDAWSKGKEIIVQSSVVDADSNPKYDSAWNVDLPTHLLYKGDSELELRVVNIDDGSISSAFIDLTTLSAGLPSIDGWYFLSSHGHKAAGQVKVTITPMESIRKYRDVWIEECRKNKDGPQGCRRDERLSCESAQQMMLNDSSSTKFKEKMKELEQLTERMKKKLLDVERWDSSPPCTLMRDVDTFAKQLLQEVEEPSQTSQAIKFPQQSVHSKGLPELDLSTVQQLCPVEQDLESPHRDSVITIEDSPPALHSYAAPCHPSRDLGSCSSSLNHVAAPCHTSRGSCHSSFSYAGSSQVSRIRKPRTMDPRITASRSISNRVVLFSNGLASEKTDSPDFGPPKNSAFQLGTSDFGSKSPVNLISFDDSPDDRRSHTYSLPSNSNDTSPTSPVNVFIREDEEKLDSDDSGALARTKLSLDKCHEELERLPKDSLDAASLAIEKMIEDLRNQNVDDSKS